MPSIVINEHELARNAATYGTDIPLIFGFTAAATATIKKPVLVGSLAEFKKEFGAFVPSKTKANKEIEYDISYIMASELLSLGMPVYYCAFNIDSAATVNLTGDLIEQLRTLLKPDDNAFIDELTDKGEYTFKYIVEPNANSDISESLLYIAQTRGDCVFIRCDINTEASVSASIKATIDGIKDKTSKDADLSYAAVFGPWANYVLSVKYKIDATTEGPKSIELPGTFGYLAALATSIKTNSNWLAIAGVSRGLLSNIDLNSSVLATNREADANQPRMTDSAKEVKYAFNAITNIKPYGPTVWGNRTLKAVAGDAELSPTHFLNIRNMISDIKKLSFRVARELMFEQNTDTLWLKVKSRITPFLEQLKAGSGIKDYQLIKRTEISDKATSGDRPLRKEEFAFAVKIYPIYAVEAFEINILISDEDVNVD